MDISLKKKLFKVLKSWQDSEDKNLWVRRVLEKQAEPQPASFRVFATLPKMNFVFGRLGWAKSSASKHRHPRLNLQGQGYTQKCTCPTIFSRRECRNCSYMLNKEEQNQYKGPVLGNRPWAGLIQICSKIWEWISCGQPNFELWIHFKVTDDWQWQEHCKIYSEHTPSLKKDISSEALRSPY